MSNSDLQAARKALRELTDAPKPVPRSVFNGWDSVRQSLFCRAGGRITDDPKLPRRMVPPQAAYQMSRADYLRAEAADRRSIR
jgi:hypothetical protein